MVRRMVFSRNTRTATDGLKKTHVEDRLNVEPNERGAAQEHAAANREAWDRDGDGLR